MLMPQALVGANEGPIQMLHWLPVTKATVSTDCGCSVNSMMGNGLQAVEADNQNS